MMISFDPFVPSSIVGQPVNLVDFDFAAQGQAPVPVPPNPAVYRLLADHFVNNTLLPAGTTVTEGIDIPFDFPTSGAMEPLNTVGITKFRNDGAQSANLQLFYPASAFNLTPPKIFWALVNGQWTLIGI